MSSDRPPRNQIAIHGRSVAITGSIGRVAAKRMASVASQPAKTLPTALSIWLPEYKAVLLDGQNTLHDCAALRPGRDCTGK